MGAQSGITIATGGRRETRSAVESGCSMAAGSVQVRSAAVAVLLVIAASVSPAQDGPPPARVVVEAVRLERVERWREVTGELYSLRRAEIAAEEPGRVSTIDVHEGDELDAGQVIAVLDDRLAALEVDRAAAMLAAAEGLVRQRRAELEQAQRDLERYGRLSNLDATTDREVDQARTLVESLEAQVVQAEADVAARRASLADARQRHEDMTIRAPFAGRVTRKYAEVGEWVQRGDRVVEVLSLEELEARVNVPESFVDRLREGSTQVRIRIPSMREPDPNREGQTVAHERLTPVTAVIPDVDPLTRQFPVRVRLENPAGRAKPGMTVVGFVPTGEHGDELTVHKDAVLRDDAGDYVFYDAEGRAMPARIRAKFAFGDRVAVYPGQLREGMRIIVEGNERVFAGQPLQFVDPPPPPNGAGARDAAGAG